MALGKDLAEIREELGVDTDEIQGLTKLPYEIIAEIESDAIFNSEIYNDAYIRNFVRSYARGLKIKEAVILRALATRFHSSAFFTEPRAGRIQWAY